MKESATCPKCDGRRLWIIERFRVPSDQPGGAPMAAVMDQPRGGFFQAIEPAGGFDMYICAACGFSELWARDLDALKARPEAGVHLQDQTDPTVGPFR